MSYKHVIIVRCGWLQSGKLSRPHVHMKARTCAHTHTHTHKRTKRESRDNEQQQTKIEASGEDMRTKTLPYLQNNG